VGVIVGVTRGVALLQPEINTTEIITAKDNLRIIVLDYT
jgi:hypothetical protein